jgi:hypothetical protein
LSAKRLSDRALLDKVQRATLRYFWEFAHPASGMALDRSHSFRPDGPEVGAVGGTGFGVMALLVGVERGWLAREEVLERLLTLLRFLETADSYHGVFPHFLDARTGRTKPFSRKDDGGDLVETSFLIMGLLCARQYFDRPQPAERELRGRVDRFWDEVEWDWHTQGGRDLLYWHWSPNHGFAMDHEIRGWDECLITYVLAAASRRHPIRPKVYHRGFAQSRTFINRRQHHGILLPLGPDGGGPMFFAHYSFMGLDPRGLVDAYANYLEQNTAHARINHAHCVANPHGWRGYSQECWGLTACDGPTGYGAHSPTNDWGVIAPTAALASMPYVPDESMAALRHFHDHLGDRIWTEMGFTDAFSQSADWYAVTHLAIDQGPIVVMIENHRTGLLWDLFMSCPEVQQGLRALGFSSPRLAPAV